MIGFIIGTVCLIGLVKVLRHGRRFGGGCGSYGGGGCGSRGRGFGGGWHRGHRGGWDGGGPPWAGRGGGFGKRFALRWLFEALDTTPGQEKVIMASVDEARTAGETARATLRKARGEVAQAMRGETVDEVALAQASAKLDAAGQALRESISAGLTKIHNVLDAEQRGRFADLIAEGPGFFRGGFGGGPYRDHHGGHEHGHDEGRGYGRHHGWDE